MHHLAEMEDGLEVPVMGHIDIPLVIRRGNIVTAARIFKQGESVCVMVDKIVRKIYTSRQFTTRYVRTKLEFVQTCQIMSA